MIRQALAACSTAAHLGRRHGGPQLRAGWRTPPAAAAAAAAPGGLAYDVSLAIDYLDFAPPARRRR